ncbi:hypothetical protein DVH24_002488 [Malus domestica]|uniref:Uncharacterized protein n=1 Tax=Malus domestica TaxID=3750 RepID=A0A498IQ53_MALDO|nr:hypothetical protein DVH24_002488 [Malus domestica]
MGGKKFAVLLCAEDTEFVKKTYGGYFGVFLRMLAEEGETWDLYRVARGEFPEDDELESFDGFVISGSSRDAHGNDAWICRLLTLLQKLDSIKKKVLGICFGHQAEERSWSRRERMSRRKEPRRENDGRTKRRRQRCGNAGGRIDGVEGQEILSRALGGKSGRAITGWDIGIRTVHLSPSSKAFSSLNVPALLSIYEIHQDEVWELPPKAELIAWSDKTGVEMFKYGDHMMGIQGHPEYTKDILLNLIDRLAKLEYILVSEAEELKAKVEACQPDRETWKRVCRSFLKGEL